ncbi:candidate inclusion membrane protein [Chlamydia trachomatis]|uniref:hypothetical protein n=1 Tax=Chlamydia trachomatis TaxID=813 RepID=UPI00061CC809|nr:hypothetical protein [Chlamydia trachomatis]CRH25427.1 candidate inclusion membrane protein [Chlamydia trachomatis]CRH26454.1 candidate inclusion membrane protein [Chlamydia trachomatis]
MSCSNVNSGAPATLFAKGAAAISSRVDTMRQMCSARVGSKTCGIALIIIGLLVATAGVVIAAVGIGTPASLAAGMILVMVGSLLLGLGLARARSRRVEIECQLEVVSMQIEELEEEYKALSEVYRANLEARRAVSKYCQELEEKILDLCKRHAATICSIEEDAKQEIRHQTERFKQRLQQNQNTCSQLTAELCKLRSENKALSERLQAQASRRKK